MKAAQDSRPFFREVQRFNQTWIWVVVLVVAGLLWRTVLKQHLFRWPPAIPSLRELPLLCSWLLFGVGLPWFIFSCRLVIEVHQDGVYFRFIPFHRQFLKISFTDFKRYEMRVYSGLGIGHGRKGRAYNISGDRGIEFTFHDGQQLIVGSQHVREFLQAIHWQCAPPRLPSALGGRKNN